MNWFNYILFPQFFKFSKSRHRRWVCLWFYNTPWKYTPLPYRHCSLPAGKDAVAVQPFWSRNNLLYTIHFIVYTFVCRIIILSLVTEFFTLVYKDQGGHSPALTIRIYSLDAFKTVLPNYQVTRFNHTVFSTNANALTASRPANRRLTPRFSRRWRNYLSSM